MKIALAPSELESALTTRFGAGALRLLGRGAEGPVYTDENRVYKVLLDPDRWKPQETLLRDLPRRFKGSVTLPRVLEVGEAEHALVVVSEFARYKELGATQPEEWLLFIRECREARIVSRNVCPKNFVRTQSGIRFVDVGSDLRELSPGGYQEMCVRAFLSQRFGSRPDVADLMRECLSRKDHPSLLGIEHFLAGLDRDLALESFQNRLTDRCLSLPGKRILDYGAGPGWLAERLSMAGRDVSAFDAGWSTGARPTAAGFVALTRADLDRMLADSARFDVIVLSRVDCEIADDEELSRVLLELRRLVHPGGRLIFATCNPFFADVRRTVTQERLSKLDSTAAGPQTLIKSVVDSGRTRQDRFRRWDRMQRILLRTGWREESAEELPGSDLDRACYASEYLFSVSRPAPVEPRVSLLIKACAMDHELVDVFVRHLIRQLEGSRAFDERLVIVDSRHDGFLRQYDRPDRAALLRKLERLREEGVIDRVVEGPSDLTRVGETYARWFGAETAAAVRATHSRSGQQLHATLYGIDACRNDLVLALDGDLILTRRPETDCIGDLVAVRDVDPDAVFVTPSIRREQDGAPAWRDGSGVPLRVDPVITLIDRARLRRLLPVRAPVEDGVILMGWHRIFDGVCSDGRARAYRRHDAGFAWIHVPNELKKEKKQEILLRIDRAEAGVLPHEQVGHIDIALDSPDWWSQVRSEPFVVVVTGRNVPPGKARRCLDSLLAQDRSDYGVIVIDDASDTELPTYLERLVEGRKDRVTLVRQRRRQGGVYNLNLALRRFCGNPESVIVTLDLDDAFTGHGVLTRLAREYATGADMTVGSMFGTDKPRHYRPDFALPRSRGNNLWQHLRSFRKRLFDAIPEQAFQLDGAWIDTVCDWAYMVPLGELARNPRYIAEDLYYYEPTKPNTPEEKERRNAIADRILAKPPLARSAVRVPLIAVVGDAGVGPDHRNWQLAYEVGRLIAQRGWRLITGGLSGVMEAASAGAQSVPLCAPGTIIGVLPGLDPKAANPSVEIVLATGLGDARGQVIANADAVVVVGGGAGTLAEVALAWKYRRLIVALAASDGWSGRLAGKRVDSRSRKVKVPDDTVYEATNAAEALQRVERLLDVYASRPSG